MPPGSEEPPKHAPDRHSPALHSPTLREHFVAGLKAAHRRRPTSFYLLLLTPVVLLLGARMAQYRDQPWHFAGMLTLLFLFCGAVLFLAVLDIFDIGRRHLREHHAAFRETLGEEAFYKELSDRAQRQRGE